MDDICEACFDSSYFATASRCSTADLSKAWDSDGFRFSPPGRVPTGPVPVASCRWSWEKHLVEEQMGQMHSMMHNFLGSFQFDEPDIQAPRKLEVDLKRALHTIS